MAAHINALYALIKQSAIKQYFESYLTADINQMALEFRTTLEQVFLCLLITANVSFQLESELISLIEKGHLKAKIDSYNKILHAKISDNRVDIFERYNNDI